MSNKYRPTAFADVKGAATKIQSVDWHTPPEVFDKLNIEFDIDVASPVGGVDWIPAKKYYTEQDDGLTQDWEGTVWMNPPYGIATGSWLDRFVKHGDGIALVFARTDTRWFHNYALKSDALLFTKGRLKFINPEIIKLKNRVLEENEDYNEEFDIAELVVMAEEILEKMIMKNPSQWIWTHNRWK